MRLAAGALWSCLAFAVAATACSTPTDPPESRLWQLDFAANWFDTDPAARRHCRMVNVLVDEEPPIGPSWESSVPMNVSRSVGDVTVTAWGDEAPTVHFRLEPLDGNRVRLVVSGAYETTVEGVDGGSSGYRGDWECRDDFPFADAPAFSEAGLDATVPVTGAWTLGPLPVLD